MVPCCCLLARYSRRVTLCVEADDWVGVCFGQLQLQYGLCHVLSFGRPSQFASACLHPLLDASRTVLEDVVVPFFLPHRSPVRTLRQKATTELLHTVLGCRHGDSVTIPSEDRVKHKASSLLLLQEVNQPHVDVLVVFEVRVLQHYADLLAPRRSHPQTFRSRPSTPTGALGVWFLPVFAVPPHSGGSVCLPDLSCDLAVGDILPEEHGVLNDHGACILVCLTH